MRMPGRMVVVAPIGTGFRVTPGPDTGVNGKPSGLRFQWVRSYQPLEARQVHGPRVERIVEAAPPAVAVGRQRSEEHTSELQSHLNLVCRLLLEKKKKKTPLSNNERR